MNRDNQQASENEGKLEKLKKWCTSLLGFFKNNKKQIYSAAMVAVMFILFKRKFYDKMVPSSDAMLMMMNKEFKKVVVGSVFLMCYLKNPTSSTAYYFANRSLINEEELLKSLQASETTYSSPIINETHIGYAMLLGLYSVMCYKLIMNMKDMHAFKGKEKRDIENQQSARTFSDVGGCRRAKQAISEIIDYIKNPDFYMKAGVRMPKGVLLYGPPGTGKTLIAKAAAAEAGIPVIYSSGSEFVEVFVGLGAKRIRDLFKQARQMAPCMIFIDEIDAVGYSRGNNNYIVGGGHREMETTLNELLNQMDGFEENDRILVVAATNLASTLDPALSRPGRFDHKIEINLPDISDRKEILKIHLKNKSHSILDPDLEQAAKQTEGLAGADLENIVNLAALQSVRVARSKNQNTPMLKSKEFLDYVKDFMEEKRRQRTTSYPNNNNFYQRQ